jgi:hypothetical protein
LDAQDVVGATEQDGRRYRDERGEQPEQPDQCAYR